VKAICPPGKVAVGPWTVQRTLAQMAAAGDGKTHLSLEGGAQSWVGAGELFKKWEGGGKAGGAVWGECGAAPVRNAGGGRGGPGRTGGDDAGESAPGEADA
jgi:hypothetical protein